MPLEPKIRQAFDEACEYDAELPLRLLFGVHPEASQDQEFLNRLLSDWIGSSVEILDCLALHGADIHHKPDPTMPEGLAWTAVVVDSNHGLRWLLVQGVEVNFEKNGQLRCSALDAAARGGNLEAVQLLVQHGGLFNAINEVVGETSLSAAMKRGHQEVVEFLRSVGAKTPVELGWKG